MSPAVSSQRSVDSRTSPVKVPVKYQPVSVKVPTHSRLPRPDGHAQVAITSRWLSSVGRASDKGKLLKSLNSTYINLRRVRLNEDPSLEVAIEEDGVSGHNQKISQGRY